LTIPLASALALSEDDLLAQAPDNMIFDHQAIRHVQAGCGPYEEVVPVLQRILGDRLAVRN
jgi:hypothetical protein